VALPRQASLGVGLATAGLVWGIYNVALPSIADVRVGEPGDRDAAAAERAATWAAAAAVSGVSLLAKDPTVFVIGGSMVIVLAWWHRHSNGFDPSLGSVFTPHSSRMVMGDAMSADAGYSPSA
jgi:hypothetical protein